MADIIKMEPHEIRARAMVLTFLSIVDFDTAKKCALLTCDEIVRSSSEDVTEFYTEVKKSINKL